MFNRLRRKTRRVEIVAPRDGWILQRIGHELASRLLYCTIVETPTPNAKVGYYVNYAMAPEQRAYATELGWFTHIEDAAPELADRFFSIAARIDVAVSQSELYATRLREHLPALRVEVIPAGVDIETYTPRPLRIGVVGRNYDYTPRKGDDILRDIWTTPGVEFAVTGSGWSVPHQHVPDEDMPEFYRSLDYLLITSRWEGGPMCAVEALAAGVPVIAPPVGWMPELPHIEYPIGDTSALRRILTGLGEERRRLRSAVATRTWDDFAAHHDRLFTSIARSA
jgi:glycosyltransferase involved in cell wall biosynthesis